MLTMSAKMDLIIHMRKCAVLCMYVQKYGQFEGERRITTADVYPGIPNAVLDKLQSGDGLALSKLSRGERVTEGSIKRLSSLGLLYGGVVTNFGRCVLEAAINVTKLMKSQGALQ